MKIAYFDCYSGISGDMLLGSLIDAGVDFTIFREQIKKLALHDFDVQCFDRSQQGITGKKVDVVWAKDKHSKHRHLKHIYQILDESMLSNRVKETSRAIFDNLAQAEAKVHGTSIEKVHFHEVGAVDSIVDIVGSALCLELLGIDKVYTSSLPLTRGYIRCEHGIMPCPAPATMELIKNLPSYQNNLIEGEIITPTGAAFLATLASAEFGGFSSIEGIGYGSGTKELPVPNFLRVMVGHSSENHASQETFLNSEGLQSDQVVIIEANIDDMNPELFAHIFEVLFCSGALDVSVSNILMKRNRPAYKMSVLAHPGDLAKLSKVILSESTSLGVRYRTENRLFLKREIIAATTEFGNISIKLGFLKDEVVQVAPEYMDCLRIAEAHNIPLKKVYNLALQAYYKNQI